MAIEEILDAYRSVERAYKESPEILDEYLIVSDALERALKKLWQNFDASSVKSHSQFNC